MTEENVSLSQIDEEYEEVREVLRAALALKERARAARLFTSDPMFHDLSAELFDRLPGKPGVGVTEYKNAWGYRSKGVYWLKTAYFGPGLECYATTDEPAAGREVERVVDLLPRRVEDAKIARGPNGQKKRGVKAKPEAA